MQSFSSDPNNWHLQVYEDKGGDGHTTLSQVSLPGSKDSSLHAVRILAGNDNRSLAVYFDGQQIVNIQNNDALEDIISRFTDGKATVGFQASSGGIRETHDVHSWSFTSLASPALNAVEEDSGVPVGAVGTLVSDLLENRFSDIDGDLPGIAITETNLRGSALYYSTDGGTNWSDVGTVSETSARMLYADSNTRLAFTPAANFSGSISDVVTLKAWDRTGGYANGSLGVTNSSWHQFGSTLSDGTAGFGCGNVAGTADACTKAPGQGAPRLLRGLFGRGSRCPVQPGVSARYAARRGQRIWTHRLCPVGGHGAGGGGGGLVSRADARGPRHGQRLRQARRAREEARRVFLVDAGERGAVIRHRRRRLDERVQQRLAALVHDADAHAHRAPTVRLDAHHLAVKRHRARRAAARGQARQVYFKRARVHLTIARRADGQAQRASRGAETRGASFVVRRPTNPKFLSIPEDGNPTASRSRYQEWEHPVRRGDHHISESRVH